MVAKKTKKSNLENKKVLFFEIGMVLALSISLIAFEWSTTGSSDGTRITNWDESIEEEIDIDITRPEVDQVPELPPPLPEIVIVDNQTDIPELDFEIDIEIDGDGAFIVPPLPDEPPVVDNVPRYFAEIMPRYRNGERINFKKHMQEIVRYPKEAIRLGLEGTVYVQFVVDKEGNVKDITIIRGIDPLLDNEVIAAIQQSETWKPGRQNGLAVNVTLSIPIAFKLQ